MVTAGVLGLLAAIAIVAAQDSKPASVAASTIIVGSFAGKDWMYYGQGESDHAIRIDSLVAIYATDAGRQTFIFAGGKLSTTIPIVEFEKSMLRYQAMLDSGKPIPKLVPQIVASHAK